MPFPRLLVLHGQSAFFTLNPARYIYYFFVYFIMSLTVQCIVYLEIALCVRLLYNY